MNVQAPDDVDRKLLRNGAITVVVCLLLLRTVEPVSFAAACIAAGLLVALIVSLPLRPIIRRGSTREPRPEGPRESGWY